jgi:hypothetical protein
MEDTVLCSQVQSCCEERCDDWEAVRSPLAGYSKSKESPSYETDCFDLLEQISQQLGIFSSCRLGITNPTFTSHPYPFPESVEGNIKLNSQKY